MSDRGENPIMTSYEMGWEYGYKVAGIMVVFQSLLAVPTVIEEEGNEQEYQRGYQDGFNYRRLHI